MVANYANMVCIVLYIQVVISGEVDFKVVGYYYQCVSFQTIRHA